MHAVYLACLIGGLVATVLFAALGALGGAGHGAGHLHAGPGHLAHGGHAHGTHQGPSGPDSAALSGWFSATLGFAASWLSPLTLAAAALWFGGAGLVAEGVLAGPMALALIVAVAAAVLGAALVRSLMGALVRASTPPLRQGAAGAVGTINAPIRLDAAGEVLYTLEGLRRSAPARTLDGRPLPRGTQVVIVRREQGMAWVTPLDPLTALSGVPAMPENAADGSDLSPPPVHPANRLG